MNINPNQTKIKSPYKPGTATKPLIIIRGYRQPVNRKAIQEYLESFGGLDQIIFHNSHITIQFATDNFHETFRKNKLRFENKSLSIKIIKPNNQKKAKRIKVLKNKNVKLKDTNFKPKDKNIQPKNKNENTPAKNLERSMNIINPLQLINEITKLRTADEQLMHLMKEIQLPYQEVETNHLSLCQYLESALSNYVFVTRGCRAMPFGSTITGLAFKWAELDVFIQNINIPDNATNDSGTIAQYITQSKIALQRTGSLYSIQEKQSKYLNTQYIRCTHESTKIICNIYFKNALGVCNSNLVYFLLNSDVRLRPMMMVIKYWAKINDIAGPKKISNYALVMLLIFYLQQNPKPILPNISMLQDPFFEKIINGWNAGYNNKFNFQTLNDYSIPYLLHGFFEFYSTYDFLTQVLSPFTGTSISKTMFHNANELDNILWLYKKNFLSNHCTKLEVDYLMCIQDPFEHNHNLTKPVNLTTIKVFQQCCTSAALICRKAIDSQSIISLLPQLLKVTNCKYEITILPTSSLNQNIDLMDIAERNNWYGRVNEILLIILKKVMKFDIRLAKHDQTTDIHDNIVESFNISCIGYFEIHHNRSKVSKKIGTSVGLKHEIAISDYIVENFNKSRLLNKKPILEMDILFIACRNPTRIVLELRNRQDELKNCFSIYEHYLQKWLPIWIDKYLQEKAEDILAASTSSRCK
ncbi:speckle targeted PIP5K1A-regulated poly(A) polymerase-like [Chrysoperla carnea]|uniref:speckle targeted PIP5K1A-regulated poly(A) polymerase-like n=1 Tax=Chrysoperla carnea TaxID=189513 RepID=UPI001D077E84|nr:speckle targeted PIP5K1A-regulated poly(A) polymerase-like [Chrysoperla carnea]XP_044728382.1 speckle targeted PIP5K1A-regulated poly(A) polymerase-like [Chrysoperla carnea]